MTIKIYNTSEHSDHKLEIEYELFKFPGGELHFKVHDRLQIINRIKVVADFCSSDDIMLICLLSDYIKCPKSLDLIYTPYARQDRVTARNEPFSLKTFARIINSCGFETVTLRDPHSDVAPALIENSHVIKRVDLVPKELLKDCVIVSPDAGAMKANNEVALNYKLPHISATKIRDVKTGEISETMVHTKLQLKGKKLVVLDDICDGGRTFIELAKVLGTHNPASIQLFVTVGIYSKGLGVLTPYFDSIDQFYKLGEGNE